MKLEKRILFSKEKRDWVSQVFLTIFFFFLFVSGEKGDGKTTLKPLHYKNTVVHRIVTGFIIQGGDFSAGMQSRAYV